jgi:hypothetical protein
MQGGHIMYVRDARDIARTWVEEEVSSLPGFLGSYLSGSMSTMPGDAVLPGASDVDVKVILDRPDVPGGPQKFVYRDLVFDVSHGSIEEIRPPESVLGNYYTAVHFTHQCILADPSGYLAEVQSVVERGYDRREWVRTRCDHARLTLEGSLPGLSPSAANPSQALATASPAAAIHDQVLAWLFPIVFTPTMVLVADLRNPTHRRGLANLGQVLTNYGHPALHERVLGIVGSEAMSRGQVETLLRACAEVFDVAQAVRATPFLLASNISDFARPIAIGGAQELIEGGYHREALPWIIFVHTLCQKVLQNDASLAVQNRFAPAYHRLLMELGVPTYGALTERNEQLRCLLPDLWNATEEIIATNPAIVD